MASIKLIQTNFTAGEISPRTMGRVDISRYHNGAKELVNGIPVIHGGVRRRYGSVFVAETKHHDKKCRLIPYVFNRDQSYMLEFGDRYMRIYSNGEQVQIDGVPYEVETPFAENDLDKIKYSQGADTLFIAHPDIRLFIVQRVQHKVWQCVPAPFVNEARSEVGHRLNADVTLDTHTGNITFTASSSVFLASDFGRTISSGAAHGEVIKYLSATQVLVSAQVDFPDLVISAGEWVLEGSPVCAIKPSGKGTVGGTITLTSPSENQVVTSRRKILGYVATLDLTLGMVARVNIQAHGFAVGNTVSIVDCVPNNWNGNYRVDEVINPNQFRIKAAQIGSPTILGSVVTRTTSPNSVAWRPEDIRKNVRVNDGLLEIISVESTSACTCEVKKVLSADVAAQALSWTLEGSTWNEHDGFPSSVTLYEQRLVLGGSRSNPSTVWLSRIGEYFNFEAGTDDDDSFSFSLSGEQYNPIAHMAQTKTLTALTYGGESTMWGGQEKAITPTNIQVKTQSTYGCNDAQPIRIGNELFFAQRAGRKIRAMSYRYDNDSYGSPDISVLSEHITESGIKAISYQQEPDSILWIVRNDGVACTLTMDRDQDVMAWARHITNGLFESIASIPVTDNDQTWIAVNRKVNGVTKRYIERFAHDTYTDCAMTFDSAEPKYQWDGLERLEGFEIDVIADGGLHKPVTVIDGKIELENVASQIIVGIPYTTKIVTLTPEIQAQAGSIQGARLNIGKVRLRLLNTIGAKVNDEPIQFREFGANALDRLEPFTGEHELSQLGWGDGNAEMTIEHDDPLPFHLIAVIYDLAVGQ